MSAPKAYIKKRELESLQALVNSEKDRELVDNKLKFFERCQQHALPTPEILGLVGGVSDQHPNDEMRIIRTPEHLLEIVNATGKGRYLLKPSRGFLGAGIKIIELKGDRLTDESGRQFDFNLFLESLLEPPATYILQKYLLPHPDLDLIMPNGNLGTARILTINTDGSPYVLTSSFKIPVGDNVTDNFHFGLTGNLACSVDKDTGCLVKTFGPDPEYKGLIGEVLFHPDNGEPLRGFEIPCWQDLLGIAIDGAKAFRELGTIGWDVALTENGPSLIEGNGRYGCEQDVLERGQKADFELLFAGRRQ